MFKIANKKKIAENIYVLKIKCPDIARKARPGNFITVQAKEDSAQISLFVADYDKNSITVLFDADNKCKEDLAKFRGSTLFSVMGPFGNAREIKDYGNVVLVGEGANIGMLLLIGEFLKKAGNKIVLLAGLKSKKSRK